MGNALIIIDLQRDYFPGGKMELSGIEDAAKNAKKLLKAFREKKYALYHIQHFSEYEGAAFFVPDTPGVDFNEAVLPLESEKVIKKNFPNSFRNTNLLEELREAEIENLVLCGAMSHMCVDATARAAFDFGFKCTVAGDACATRDLQYQNKTIAAEQVHGAFMAALFPVYAQLKNTEEILLSL
ncbi:MAG: cysteine hydrolase [SAR324 cluster bacterium]|nr:cysteine hydrolase [SAR324 cluster bacterium]